MPNVHHLKLSLKNTKPPIWRELFVPSDIRLDRLHQVIQIVMGWENCHLHEFSVGPRGPGQLIFAPPQKDFDLGFDFGPKRRNEKSATLSDLAPNKGNKFTYWYDFGDDWHHDIQVKGVAEMPSPLAAPVCIKAAGACPPEDSGGPWGYANMLEIPSDPAHEEYEELSQWIGADWDAEQYDIEQVNRDLQNLAQRWTPRSKSGSGSAKSARTKD